jgi:Rap1a immunity proteins
MRTTFKAMLRAVTVVVASCCLGIAGQATAYYYDGTKLFELCENYVVPSAPPSNETEWNNLVKVSKCQNYVVGVVDAFVDKPGVLCVPQDKVQVGDVVAIVSSSLNDHPTDRNRPAADLVIGAQVIDCYYVYRSFDVRRDSGMERSSNTLERNYSHSPLDQLLARGDGRVRH